MLVILLSGSVALSGQTRQENWERCAGKDPDQSVGGCSALTQSNQETGTSLAAAFYDRGIAYAHKHDFDHAIQDYDQALRINAVYARAFCSRGRAYAGKRDFDRAIQDYDRALQIKPDYADAFIMRGNAYTLKSQYDRAIQDFDDALQINPTSADAFYGRGLAHQYKGE